MASILNKRVVECPHCWIKTMQAEIDVFGPNIIIDRCPECQGSWLDGGELQKMLKGRKLADYLTKDIGTKTRSKLVCPRCGGLMDIEKAGDVEVDVCVECRGVWLDDGELKELKKKAKEGFEGDPHEKAVERWEEHQWKRKNSPLYRFLDGLMGLK